MEKTGTLYLIPVNISDAPLSNVLPDYVLNILPSLHFFIVEDVRTARRFLRKAHRDFDIDAVTFFELNTHSDPSVVASMLEPLSRGENIGLMSEAGCPAVADPGSLAVAEAQKKGFKVVPLVGPSSILLSLMGSGFNGQSFCFHGYLPLDSMERNKILLDFENRTRKNGMTHIFIETPYRNNKLLEQMINVLDPDTMVCVAAGVTDMERESILTLPVKEWRKRPYDYNKTPAIFLIGRTDMQVRKQTGGKSRR